MFLSCLTGSEIFFVATKSETCQKNLVWQIQSCPQRKSKIPNPDFYGIYRRLFMHICIYFCVFLFMCYEHVSQEPCGISDIFLSQKIWDLSKKSAVTTPQISYKITKITKINIFDTKSGDSCMKNEHYWVISDFLHIFILTKTRKSQKLTFMSQNMVIYAWIWTFVGLLCFCIHIL